MIEIVVFSVLLVFGFGWFTMNILKVRQNILLGRDVKRSDKTSERWSTMLLVAFGQKKNVLSPDTCFASFNLIRGICYHSSRVG